MDNQVKDDDIWWIRHGESISNFYENAIEDAYIDIDSNVTTY